MERQKIDNPLQYNIHPLDFIKKIENHTEQVLDMVSKDLENTLKSVENGLSSLEKNHTDTLDEAYGGSVDQKEKLDEFRRDFFDKSFPW